MKTDHLQSRFAVSQNSMSCRYQRIPISGFFFCIHAMIIYQAIFCFVLFYLIYLSVFNISAFITERTLN